MEKIRVNQDTRVVRAYREDFESDEEFAKLEKFTKLGYKVKWVKKPTKHKQIKNDMIKYLENNIDDDLYLEFIDRVEKQEKFLTTKWWLVKELEKRAADKGKESDTIEEIINKAKSKEIKLVERAKAKAEAATAKEIKNKNKAEQNENK